LTGQVPVSHGAKMTAFLPQADFPAARPRRNRRDDFTRRLVREHSLSVDDFIYPVFIAEGKGLKQAVPSMPGVDRYSIDTLLPVAERCVELGIPVMALFPAIEGSLKTLDGIEAANPDGLVPRAVRELKSRFPELGVLTDVRSEERRVGKECRCRGSAYQGEQEKERKRM